MYDRIILCPAISFFFTITEKDLILWVMSMKVSARKTKIHNHDNVLCKDEKCTFLESILVNSPMQLLW